MKEIHNEEVSVAFIKMCWKKLPFSKLPDDVLKLIVNLIKKKYFIIKLQACWRGFRIRKLMTRFICLRYLQEFRDWNPTAIVYLSRCRSSWLWNGAVARSVERIVSCIFFMSWSMTWEYQKKYSSYRLQFFISYW